MKPLAVLLLAVAAQGDGSSPRTLDEARLTLGKWIETQQIISKERNEWQQGKEVLRARVELLHQEVTTVRSKIEQAQAGAEETKRKREALAAENGELQSTIARLAESVARKEDEVRQLLRSLPEPVRTKLEPLRQRIPDDPATTRVTAAERFQNVLGILNELNKANNEITVQFEVRTLADGKPSEVKVIYVGLAQAYYVSARGEAGIGRPATGGEGWTWEPSAAAADGILLSLEILEGKHTPAFVPLPVKIQ